ncbi:MAG: hypothetical protein O3C21_07415, partial [Verrucomicrobia bacterium]|nr:hypothetical protein [Verrucomicrobiota bacterium]
EVKLIHQAMAIAARHMDLSRATQASKPEALKSFAAQQQKLAGQCAALIQAPKPPAPPEPPAAPVEEEPEIEVEGEPAEGEPEPEPVVVEEPAPPAPEPHAKLVAAHRHLSEAAAKLKASERDLAITRQTEAGDALRYFILEYALKYVMIPPPGPPEDPSTNPSDEELVEQAILPLFEPGALTGNKPNGGRLEWQVLGRRDRAALNENFARELPLEYRAILKDYYERLTE